MKSALFALVFFTALSGPLSAEEIRAAVASNFATTFTSLARAFAGQSRHRVVIATGSTGKHYAQIRHGAPFDLFFAADAERPILLEQQGFAAKGSRFIYAYGRLVLWQPQHSLAGGLPAEGSAENQVLSDLKRARFRYLAIANPGLAPYGKAAEETLVKLGLWERFSNKIVRGENIAQAFHFVSSGNAQMGFVARSQIINLPNIDSLHYWDVPGSYYQAIEQQAVILKNSPAATDFMAFVLSPAGTQIIREGGYLSATEIRP